MNLSLGVGKAVEEESEAKRRGFGRAGGEAEGVLDKLVIESEIAFILWDESTGIFIPVIPKHNAHFYAAFSHFGEEGGSDLLIRIQVLRGDFLPFQFIALEAKSILVIDKPSSDSFVFWLRNQGSSVEVGEERSILNRFVGKEIVLVEVIHHVIKKSPVVKCCAQSATFAH